LGDYLIPYEGAGGNDEHARVRQPRAFGSDHTSEVDLIAHHDVGPPLGAQRENMAGSIMGRTISEALTQDSILPFGAGLEQWQPLGRIAGVGPRGDGLETRRPNRREHCRLPGDDYLMTHGFGGAGNGNKWVEVPATTDKGEEDAQRAGPLD
jgi:hypothetical protein